LALRSRPAWGSLRLTASTRLNDPTPSLQAIGVGCVAEVAAAKALEPNVEPIFHEDSYGYRPGRAPVDAVAVCRERCFRKAWVVDLDIRAFFDSVSWELMLRAVACHTDQKWIVMYVERWLKAPMQRPGGALVQRVKGTPQGSPISPVLANLFLHYGFDAWMVREFPTIQFERFADDAVIHCVSERQARLLRAAVARRLADVGLELHPDKTRIVYCKDSLRSGVYEHVSFTFCGYTFRPRKAYNRDRHRAFTGFMPAVSPEKLTAMSRRVSSWRIHRRITLTIDDLAVPINQRLRGWLAYFTAFYPSAVNTLCDRINCHLVRWARWKYKRLARSDKRARAWLRAVYARTPELFVHWRYCAPSR